MKDTKDTEFVLDSPSGDMIVGSGSVPGRDTRFLPTPVCPCRL